MVHRTMQGKEIDMEKLMRQNELMPAVGNMRVNARGDELGSGGRIMRKREDIVADYYEQNPNAVLKQSTKVSSPSVSSEIVEEQKVVVAPTRKKQSEE